MFIFWLIFLNILGEISFTLGFISSSILNGDNSHSSSILNGDNSHSSSIFSISEIIIFVDVKSSNSFVSFVSKIIVLVGIKSSNSLVSKRYWGLKSSSSSSSKELVISNKGLFSIPKISWIFWGVSSFSIFKILWIFWGVFTLPITLFSIVKISLIFLGISWFSIGLWCSLVNIVEIISNPVFETMIL